MLFFAVSLEGCGIRNAKVAGSTPVLGNPLLIVKRYARKQFFGTHSLDQLAKPLPWTNGWSNEDSKPLESTASLFRFHRDNPWDDNSLKIYHSKYYNQLLQDDLFSKPAKDFQNWIAWFLYFSCYHMRRSSLSWLFCFQREPGKERTVMTILILLWSAWSSFMACLVWFFKRIMPTRFKVWRQLAKDYVSKSHRVQKAARLILEMVFVLEKSKRLRCASTT